MPNNGPREHWLDAAFNSFLEELPEEVRRRHVPSEQEVIETLPEPVESVVPEEDNCFGIERTARAVIGLFIGSMGIIGVVAASDLALGIALAIISVAGTGYLLATAKTRKCPAKRVMNQHSLVPT